MRSTHLFVILLVAVTAVSCTPTSPDNALPTQVPTAIPIAGPPGTNKLNAPWTTIANSDIGISIEHPQDWFGNSTNQAIRLSPISNLAESAEYNIPANASLFMDSAIGSANIVASLEMFIAASDFGPPESVTQLVAPTAVSINNYEAAIAQLTFTPTPFTPPPEVLEETSPDTFPDPVETYLYVVAIRQNEQTIIFTGSVPSEYSEDYLPVFEAMANTIQIVSR